MKNRKPNRLKQFNYSYKGIYFVTICTKNKEEYFGQIRNKTMVLNKIGVTASKFWQEIPDHFTDIEIDNWVIMPNHIHGILKINKPVNIARPVGVAYMPPSSQRRPYLSQVIQQYKASVTRKVNKIQDRILFQWQRSFYDHIIMNKNALKNIREYITNNPQNWEYDDENPQKIKI